MVKSYAEGAQGRRQREEPVRYDIGPYILTLLSLAFFTKNASVTYRLKSKIGEFLGRVDNTLYEDNPTILWCIRFADMVASAVLEHYARDYTSVKHRVLEDIEWAEWHDAFFQTFEAGVGHQVEGEILENELSDEQVKFVDEYVSTRLRYTYLWQSRGQLKEIVARLDAKDTGHISDFSNETLSVLEKIVHAGRLAQSVGGLGAVDFRTGDTSFEAAIRSAHREANRPQALVQTGCRLLNDMLGGGYQGGRVYVHFGRSGDWKSGILCSAAFWATNPVFNPEFVCRDPTRKPAVLFITQENDVNETIERMISYAIGSEVDLRGSSEEEMVRMLCEAYSSENCEFVFKYRQNRSIDADDIAAMIEELFLDGLEVVMVVQDYIKRMKSVENFKDQRHLELGAIVDEASAKIAKRFNIPYVTGMQLNREAYKKIEDAVKSGKTDAVKELGASNVGESINVYENADVVIMQARVFMESIHRIYLTLRRAKMRGKRRGGVDYFAQPFAIDAGGLTNEMLLEQDAHLPERDCKGKKDLGDSIAADYDPNETPGGLSSEDRRANRTERSLGGHAPPSTSPRRRGATAPPPPKARSQAAPPQGGTGKFVGDVGIVTATEIPEEETPQSLEAL